MQDIRFTLKEIGATAKTLLEKSTKTLALNGPMGAGKTTLIKEMVRQLGGQPQTHSPTFGIVNEYADTKGDLLAYHFDFYRIEDQTEALDLGIEEYFDQDCWIFMEWPENIADLLPADTVHVHLRIVDPVTRLLSW